MSCDKSTSYGFVSFSLSLSLNGSLTLLVFASSVYIIVLIVNTIGCMGAMIENVANGTGMFTFALVTVFIFTPLSYVCWFRPLYKAFRDDSSFNFMLFFFVFFCQIVLSAVWALGIPGVGAMYVFCVVGKWIRY